MTDLRRPLDQAELQRAIPSGWLLQVVPETGSTNADLLAAAAAGAPARTVLAAELQTAGRGRLERAWVSPAGAGLTVSILLRPSPPPARWGWLPLLAGLALAEAIAEAAPDGSGRPLPVALKWPNDVLIGGADQSAGRSWKLEGPDDPEPARIEGKVAGVLVQSAGPAVVLGLGTNVSTTAAELPVPEATSLSLSGAAGPDRGALLIQLLARLGAQLGRWETAGGNAVDAGLARDYRARCATIDSEVTVQMPGRAVAGRALAVDDSGRLLVQPQGGGEPLAVSAGDVTHVRPRTR